MRTRPHMLLRMVLCVITTGAASQVLQIDSKELVGGVPKNSLELAGYVKLVIAYDYLGLPNGSSFNMIEIPTVDDVENRAVSFNVWQSRIKLTNSFITNKEEKIKARLEGDFHGGNGGGFRLRHAYINFRNWTVGQTNTVFSNSDVWLNIADFDGPPVGVWVRQPQVRFTLNLGKRSQFNFSIEDPVVDFRKQANVDPQITPTKSYLPDFLVNYRYGFNGGTFQISAVGRVLAYQNGDVRQKTYGYGGNISGTFSVFKKDLLIYQALAGKGIERYLVGLGGYGLDAASYENKLNALPVYGGYLGYQHFWNKTVNSSIMYGYQEVQNKFYADYAHIFVGNYYSANLFFYPIENVAVGFEFVYGDKKDYLDQKGRNHRYYATVEYSF